jgi:hypothetical protein
MVKYFSKADISNLPNYRTFLFCPDTEMARLSEDDLDELSVSDARQMLQAALDIIIRFNEACDEYWAEEIKEARK